MPGFRTSSDQTSSRQRLNLSLRHTPSSGTLIPIFSDEVATTILRRLEPTDLHCFRLVCKHWCSSIASLAPPCRPNRFCSLPTEVILQIYNYLNPAQFNAARHTCSAWRLASLDATTLHRMMQRAGLQSAIEVDPTFKNCAELESLAILLSEKLSRECALMPEWKSCGLRTGTSGDTFQPGRSITGLRHTTTTDMTDLGLAAGEFRYGPSCNLTFTISMCQRFALVLEGCTIYAYHLDGQNIIPVTSVICPKRVIAASMDTSERRFAVAALLDGRMGLVCDLDLDELHREPPSPRVYSDTSGAHASRRGAVEEHELYAGAEEIPTPANNINTSTLPLASSAPLPSLAGQRRRRDDMDNNDFAGVNSIHIRSADQSVSLINASRGRRTTMDRRGRTTLVSRLPSLSDINNLTNSSATHEASAIFNSEGGITNHTCTFLEAIPISPSALSIYNALCSPDDPPRSVAICPSRRCVAFGCGAGVELHWVDARGGRNLMKWFPLTAPSDCLFFLPTRLGRDGPNKLRLISSKTGPHQRERCLARPKDESGSEHLKKRRRWSGWPFVHLNSDASSSNDAQEYDHYSAVPISDGAHLIFTDPASGTLCLGSDAPLGNSIRLLRKIKFIPPVHVVDPDANAADSTPQFYAAGASLTWGIKTVAVYGGDKIVLYFVPPDIFADVKHVGAPVVTGNTEDGPQWQLGEWSKWWPTSSGASSSDATPNGSVPCGGGQCFWPVPVAGALVGSVPNIVDIGVQNEGDSITVWAFTRDGFAHTWHRGDPSRLVSRRAVERNGLVVDVAERDGDWVVRDMWGNEEETQRDVQMRDAPPTSRRHDAEGDLRMRGLDGSLSSSEDSEDSATGEDFSLEVLASAGMGSLDRDTDMMDVAPREDAAGVTWILDPEASRRVRMERAERTQVDEAAGESDEGLERWEEEIARPVRSRGRLVNGGVDEGERRRQGQGRMLESQWRRYDGLRRCSPTTWFGTGDAAAAGEGETGMGDGSRNVGFDGGAGLGGSRWARWVS